MNMFFFFLHFLSVKTVKEYFFKCKKTGDVVKYGDCDYEYNCLDGEDEDLMSFFGDRCQLFRFCSNFIDLILDVYDPCTGIKSFENLNQCI